ncbi:MAG TPA: hypothetical protein VF522_04295 [Ramlibacter sp.]|uniref:hypothetical protein n=1 Tax=Ramlibacter sp. TaxID=1917967 RepID=UPI002ED08810
MNLMRKLACIAPLLTSGPGGASDAPRAASGPAAETRELPAPGPWLIEDDDEFEGEGWAFWPLERSKR